LWTEENAKISLYEYEFVDIFFDLECCPNCRVREGRPPPDRTPCASRKSALEKLIHDYAEKFGDKVIDLCLEKMFDSLGEAYD
jgi:hypothetical protein